MRNDEVYIITPRRTTAMGNPYGPPQQPDMSEPAEETVRKRRPVEVVNVVAPPPARPAKQAVARPWAEIVAEMEARADD